MKRQTDTQNDRNTDRQTDRQTDKQEGRKKEKEIKGKRERNEERLGNRKSREREGVKEVEKEELHNSTKNSMITCHSSGKFLLCFFLVKSRLELLRMRFHSLRELNRRSRKKIGRASCRERVLMSV